jgi:shikimate dehydrogenase
VLDLPWTYDAVDVTEETLPAFVAGCDDEWRGLSLTMPLKRDILPLLTARDPVVDQVGGANTVLFGDGGTVTGFNTDVRGVVESFAGVGVTELGHVHVLGAGATAASVVVAVAQLGATRILVSARTPARAVGLVDLAARLGIELTVMPWGAADPSLRTNAIVSTVPGGANDLTFSADTRESAVLFDVAYEPWPSDLARDWAAAGGTVISGLDLLVNQAVGQIRIFVAGDPETPLPNETDVVAAMRAAAR